MEILLVSDIMLSQRLYKSKLLQDISYTTCLSWKNRGFWIITWVIGKSVFFLYIFQCRCGHVWAFKTTQHQRRNFLKKTTTKQSPPKQTCTYSFENTLQHGDYPLHTCTTCIWLMCFVCDFLTLLIQWQQDLWIYIFPPRFLSRRLCNILFLFSRSDCVQPLGINAQHITTILSILLILF